MTDTTQSRCTLFYGGGTSSWNLSNFAVEKIGHNRAFPFVSEYHYSGGMGNAAMPYGIVQEHTGELVGVVAFHTPISENVRASVFGPDHVDSVTELHRMAIHPDAPHNTASWAISRALSSLKSDKPKYKAVLSFADTTEGHDGTVYQAANADYAGMSQTATFYRDDDGRLRAPRQCGENVDPEARGWEKESRDAKHRYVFWIPDPYESKDDLRERCELELQPYP